MRQWDLNLWHEALSPTSATVTWTYESPAGRWTHGLVIDVVTTEAYPVGALQLELTFRTLCHRMIDVLPPALLMDAADCLSDVYRSYLSHVEAGGRKKLPAASPPIRGRFRETEQRRPLSFSDQG
jgi:hypothetical protein